MEYNICQNKITNTPQTVSVFGLDEKVYVCVHEKDEKRFRIFEMLSDIDNLDDNIELKEVCTIPGESPHSTAYEKWLCISDTTKNQVRIYETKAIVSSKIEPTIVIDLHKPGPCFVLHDTLFVSCPSPLNRGVYEYRLKGKSATHVHMYKNVLCPSGLSATFKYLFVADTENNEVYQYNRNTHKKVMTFFETAPTSVACTDDGVVYIGYATGNKISVYGAEFIAFDIEVEGMDGCLQISDFNYHIFFCDGKKLNVV